MLLRICILFAASVVVGCSTRAPITTYKHSLASSSSDEAIAIDAVFHVSNTNDEPIELLLYEYAVSVNGNRVFEGLHEAKLTVPRWSIIESQLPIVIPIEYFGSDITEWQLSGTLSYVESDAFADTLRKAGLSKPSTSIRARDTFGAIRAE